MMDHEDWLEAVNAGYEIGFSIPPEELPSRDTYELGDERHQAWVVGLGSGQRARVEADAMEAEHREFFENYIRPVAQATAADMNRGTPEQQKAIRLARSEELAAANRAASIPWMEPVATKPAPQPAAPHRSQSRSYQPFRRSQDREMSR